MKVQALPYRLLVMLLERSGEIVTREEVRQRLWPENSVIKRVPHFSDGYAKAVIELNDRSQRDPLKKCKARDPSEPCVRHQTWMELLPVLAFWVDEKTAVGERIGPFPRTPETASMRDSG